MKIRTIYGRGKYVYGRSKVLIRRRVSITDKISISRGLDLASMSQSFAARSIPQYPMHIGWDAGFSFTGEHIYLDDSITFEVTPMESTRIKCPTCGAVVGQRDDNGTEIVEWNHIGPCDAPCAGKRFRGCRRQRNSTDGLHTKQACPRCAPQTCPSCNDACACLMCRGTGEKRLAYGALCGCRFGWGIQNPPVSPDRRPEEYLPAGVTSCKHGCKRCRGTGKVHGLEAAA